MPPMPPELPPWVTLSLVEALSPEALCARASEHGVRAELTSTGAIQLPGGFLATLEAEPFPRELLDRSLARADVVLGPASLHVSGGTNELERDAHRQPAALRQMLRENAAAAAAALGLPTDEAAVIKSAAARKVERLTELVTALAPLAHSIILPQANHLAFDAAELAAEARTYVGSHNYHFPLWVLLQAHEDVDAPFLSTTGMSLFALPELAAPHRPGEPRDRVVQMLGNLQREMVAEGWWPEDGSRFRTSVGEVELEEAQDALLVHLLDDALPDEILDVAHYRWALERCVAQILGPHTRHRRAASAGGLATTHYIFRHSEPFAMTVGLGLDAQPGGTAEDENELVELAVFSPKLGPWADRWLDWAGEYLMTHDPARPIRPYDRIVTPSPANGIAAVILWPHGSLLPTGSEGPEIQLWDMIPIVEAELADFRRDPEAQGRWLDERWERRDVHELHRRWTT